MKKCLAISLILTLKLILTLIWVKLSKKVLIFISVWFFILFYLSKIRGQTAHLSTALTRQKEKKYIYIYYGVNRVVTHVISRDNTKTHVISSKNTFKNHQLIKCFTNSKWTFLRLTFGYSHVKALSPYLNHHFKLFFFINVHLNIKI